MSLSKEALDEFKQIYKEKYGEELTDFVASDAANRLVNLVSLVYKPIPREHEADFERITKEQAEVPESEKKDLVKHLVEDSKFTEFKIRLTKDKSKKEAREIDTQLVTFSFDLELVIKFLKEHRPELPLLTQIDPVQPKPDQLLILLAEFNNFKEPIEIPERTKLALSNIVNLMKVMGFIKLTPI